MSANPTLKRKRVAREQTLYARRLLRHGTREALGRVPRAYLLKSRAASSQTKQPAVPIAVRRLIEGDARQIRVFSNPQPPNPVLSPAPSP